MDSEVEQLKEALRKAKEEIAEHEASLSLRHKADMRGIKAWQGDDPDRQKVWPDHGDLVTWLLEKLDTEKENNRGLSKRLAASEEKWRYYENDYILPCFERAKLHGIDLGKLVRERSSNCVKLLIDALEERLKIAEQAGLTAAMFALREMPWNPTGALGIVMLTGLEPYRMEPLAINPDQVNGLFEILERAAKQLLEGPYKVAYEAVRRYERYDGLLHNIAELEGRIEKHESALHLIADTCGVKLREPKDFLALPTEIKQLVAELKEIAKVLAPSKKIVEAAKRWYEASERVKNEKRDPMTDETLTPQERTQIGLAWDAEHMAAEELSNAVRDALGFLP